MRDGDFLSLYLFTGATVAVHGERDRNFRLDAPGGRYLLKVHNPADGEKVLDLQYSALRHIRAVAPDVPVPDVVPTRHSEWSVALTGLDGRRSLAWVMTWLEGRSLMRWLEEDPPQEERDAIAEALFRAWYVPFYRYGVIHGDPHMGNYQVRPGGR